MDSEEKYQDSTTLMLIVFEKVSFFNKGRIREVGVNNNMEHLPWDD